MPRFAALRGRDERIETARRNERWVRKAPPSSITISRRAFKANLLRNRAARRNGLRAQTSPIQKLFTNMNAALGGGMENFLLFVLSSSFCTLVASITLLLRPLLGLP
jgi:hypothetical protein